MPLSAGTRLGSYEILSALGAGGMGEVYRARDTRLDRDVAIKILPEAFAADAERVARFQREAKVLASLNHSHIAVIYGLEDADGVKALVMELVEGEDLAQRLARGAMPLDEALPIAKQIAEALEAAHEQGIIHRDLKPSNIKLRPDGTVKVLDFGIAKMIEVGPRSGEVSGSPTVTRSAMTRLGMVLGTPAYMSPEQARGHQAETRTDVWAFGCVLYEMLTGVQAFGALTPTDTIAAVIKGDPDWTLLPPALPQGMARVLRRCLAKDPRQRFRDIADVRLDIADALAESPLESAGEATSTRTDWRYLAAAAIAGCLVGAVAVALVDRFTTRQASPVGRTLGVVRLTLPLAERERLVASRDLPLGLGRPAVAISPDGTRVAYVAVREGVTRLYVRTLDEPEARSIPGTEGALSPFFSPDGQWLGFLADVKLKKVSLLGGDPVVLCDARNALGASWGDDDGIVFADGEASRLVRVPAGGGPVQLVTHAPGGGVRAYAWPDLLPGGKSVLVTEDAGAFGTEALRVNWVSLETGESRALVSGSSARYLPPGYIVFLRSGTLMAASFDTSRVLVGDPVPLINHISRDDAAAQFGVSRDGSLVYATGTESATGALTWVDRRGSATPVGAPVRAYGTFRISPDGRRLALQTMGATADIWTYDFERRHLTRLTTSANNGFPIWTADGKFVTYGSDRTGRPTLFKQLADGSREAERLISHDQGQIPYDWSSDGRVLVFGETGRDTAFDIWLLPADGDRTPRPFIQTTFMEWGLRFSPDGQWAAYTSDVSGRYEVYVRPYPGPGERYQISSEGGEEPVWHPGGRELFYRNGQKWMAVAVAALSSFQAQTPQLAFEGPYLNVAGASYDIARDGSRFLVIKGNDRPPITSLQVVLNWPEELKQRVPIR